MAFQIDEFIRTRPFLYHLTAPENLAHIRAGRSIAPACQLMVRARRNDMLRQKRKNHEQIRVGEQTLFLRDQKPLYSGKMSMPEGYAFEDFVESLNSRVFFWPGKAEGPNAHGVRHFERYEGEGPVIARMRFQSLIALNPGLAPLFCKYNSGAPRVVNGKKSPRGPKTFVREAEFEGTACDVVEVTFAKEISLPEDAEFGFLPDGPWQRL